MNGRPGPTVDVLIPFAPGHRKLIKVLAALRGTTMRQLLLGLVARELEAARQGGNVSR